MTKTLRVRAVGDVLVPVLNASGQLRYVGRQYDVDKDAFVPCGIVEIPDCAEYRRDIAAGDLIDCSGAKELP